MRFNSRELSCLARQTADRFDKEGILFAKERQEGIFRKSEVYVERLFRLRGNLLFYFKTRDVSSEVLGVFVLERCVVQLDDDEDDHSYYSFIIVFEGDDRVIRLATQVEADRDSWIGSLHVASYECMKIQLQSLREQLRSRTGKDPFSSQELAAVTSLPETTDADKEPAEDPFLEMCLMCVGLPAETSGRLPDTFASVHYMLPPPDERWVIHARTEIVEKSCHPMYVTMIGFRNPQSFSIATRIKVTIYSVKERMTNTMTQVGSIIFNLADILDAPANRISLKLCSFDYHDVGSVVVTAWQSDCSFRLSSWSGESLVSPSDRQSNSKSIQVPVQNGVIAVSSLRRQSLTMLKLFFSNILCKTFRFPVNASPNHQLFVYEYMGEGKLTYVLPRQLLKLFVEEEKNEIEKLQSLGTLVDDWDKCRQSIIDYHLSTVASYEQHIHYLETYTGTTFKPSAKKAHKEVEFAPTNLHIQRMNVYNSEQDATRTYDIVTAGAFTAGAHKYRHGGLRRLIQQLEQRSYRVDKGRTRLTAVVDILADMDALLMATNAACGQVCTAAVQGKADELKVAMAELEDKGRGLVKICESDLVTEGVTELSSARVSTSQPQPTSVPQSTPSDGGGGGSRPGSRSMKSSSTSSETWRWSGTDFVKSPTEEPWDLTRLNAEAAVVCVLSKAEDLAKQAPEEAVSWLDSLSPLVIKLKRCIEVMCSRAKSGLAFTSVKDCSPNLPLVHSLNYRRDVVFSQAVTTATTGFLTALLSADETTMKQMLDVGILLQFECLLSCHGDEMAMLEDMAVGVNDLLKVTFALERAPAPVSANDDVFVPTISGDRTEFVVTVPLPDTMFDRLQLDGASKRFVRVVPVMFTIGINEQATLAERFGDVSLQETLNLENYHRLHDYFQKYTEFLKLSESKDAPSSPSSASASSYLNLENQIRHLQMSVLAKRNKNVDVLHQAGEVCRALHGVRFTSCKSAKDRTAMAVTLEQVQLLSRENDLGADVFFHALGSFRSEGVRRENTVKNSGVRKYAFNSIQLLSLPKLYRPPNGTYGNYET